MIKFWLSSLAAVLFPGVCHCCGRTLNPYEKYICTPCRSALPRIPHVGGSSPMLDKRLKDRVAYERAGAMWRYSPGAEVSILFQDFKYRGFEHLAVHLGEEVGKDFLLRSIFANADMLVPVPMHWWKHARRGYNQAASIARGISRTTGLPVCKLLYARRNHATQTRYGALERMENMRGVFACRSSNSSLDAHVVIVDDVCTTGTTLVEAAGTLRKAYPKLRISLFALGATFD